MRKVSVAIAVFLLLVSCDSHPAQKNIPTYRIGYMICNSEQETMNRFAPLTAFLSKKMGVNFEAVTIDTIQFTKEIENLDFTHTNSLLYVTLKRFHGVEVLAAEKKGSLAELSQGVIIALKKSDIKTIDDLRGKSMIFGPALAPTGFMSQIDIMQRHGFDPEEDLSFYTIPTGSFKHEKVIYGVLFEKYDAGAIPLDDIESMAADDRIDADEFTIVSRGPALPYCNFGVTQRVEERFARKFKNIILSISQEDTVELNGEVVKVLDRALAEGYVDINDADFDIVREMAKRTNMPPYQKF